MSDLKFSLFKVYILIIFINCLNSLEYVQRWDTFEVCLRGPQQSQHLNPFIDVKLNSTFTTNDGQSTKVVNGFYNGDGNYCVRFMPQKIGKWSFITDSNIEELKGKMGEFDCIESDDNNHGPVSVHNTYHFSYADGTKFIQIGTTVYGLPLISDDWINETLQTLMRSPFNKVRICLLPIEEVYNITLAPYELTSDNKWNFSVFNPIFFKRLDSIIINLRDLNIEADIIFFNPYYPQFGFGIMSVENDELMVSYAVSRLSAYRNIWWSAANEYDRILNRTISDWDRIGAQIRKQDPYNHLRSIHFSRKMYNPCEQWVTHSSVQNGHAVQDFGRAVLYRDVCPKPVVYDEVGYEGNFTKRWAQLTAQQMTLRFWMATIGGTYLGHGEVIGDPKYSWVFNGGKLLGQSAPRIAFLRHVLENSTAERIDAIDPFYENYFVGFPGFYYLVYFGEQTPEQWRFQLFQFVGSGPLHDGLEFTVDILDTWNMTVKRVNQIFTIKRYSNYYFSDQSNAMIELPAQPYMALRVERIN